MMAVSNDLLEAVAGHPGLKELKIGGPTLASSPPGFFFPAQSSKNLSHLQLLAIQKFLCGHLVTNLILPELEAK